jgi:hypothetical protein
MEGSLVAYKVFTNGSVLNASEINDNLMNQSVMVFSNSAARSAALTSPLAGMLTYLQDTGLYSSWNGSAWVSLDVSLVSSNSFTGSSSVNIDGVFSSNFQNYSMALTLTSSVSGRVRSQMRAGGVNETSSNYFYGSLGIGTWVSQTFFNVNNSARTAHDLGDSNSTFGLNSFTYIYNPNTILRKGLVTNSLGQIIELAGTTLDLTTQYDGIRIFPSSGTITGTVRIYGLRD